MNIRLWHWYAKTSASRSCRETDILEQADGIRIHTLKGLEIYHQTFMFWMKNRYRLPAVERFTEYMKQHADIIEESRNDSENVSKVYLKDIVNF